MLASFTSILHYPFNIFRIFLSLFLHGFALFLSWPRYKKKIRRNSIKKILVIDDDPDILEAIQLFLEEEGYTVDVSPRNGDYLDDAVKRDQPGLIILDVLLSGQDGRVICRALKSREDTKHIPVVMISALPGAEKDVREAGADAFIAKPFDIDRLLGTVQRYIPTN